MITPEQAKNAIAFLEALGTDSLLGLEYEESTYKRDMLEGSIRTLRTFVDECSTIKFETTDIKIVYAYKLYRSSDGKFMDRSNWTEKGKTYASRKNMIAALGSYIMYTIEQHPERPRYYIKGTKDINTNYYGDYRKWEELRQNKEWRASLIPDDWIVRCIPTNTKGDIVELPARKFYIGKKK